MIHIYKTNNILIIIGLSYNLDLTAHNHLFYK